ncbi:SdpI family protein [Blautia producta]|nr:SdpI family protein [Blautia producta]NSG14881.1 SdpI family protein [Blautia producta]NSJ75072.1 SdpI family protein [Blautia producta]
MVWQSPHMELLLFAGIVINVALNIVLNFRVCKTMGAKFLVKLGTWIMPFTSIFLVIVSVYSAIYQDSSFPNSATIVFVGMLFIVSGNYFPKNHVNKYVGLKFPWLLKDEESWDKTHKLAGYTWILAGMIFVLQLFVSPLKIVSIPLVIILVGVLPLIYSLMLVYKRKRR